MGDAVPKTRSVKVRRTLVPSGRVPVTTTTLSTKASWGGLATGRSTDPPWPGASVPRNDEQRPASPLHTVTLLSVSPEVFMTDTRTRSVFAFCVRTKVGDSRHSGLGASSVAREIAKGHGSEGSGGAGAPGVRSRM